MEGNAASAQLVPVEHSIQDGLKAGEYDRPVPTGWKVAVKAKMDHPAMSWKEVAQLVGYSYATVLLWTRKPEFQRYESFMVDKILPDLPIEAKTFAERVKVKFETYSEEMQDRLLGILERTDDPKLEASIAQDWLDRSGHGSKKVDGKAGLALVVSEEMLRRFVTRAVEAEVIDVTPNGHPTS